MQVEYFKGFAIPIQYQTTNVRQRDVAKQQSYKKLPLISPLEPSLTSYMNMLGITPPTDRSATATEFIDQFVLMRSCRLAVVEGGCCTETLDPSGVPLACSLYLLLLIV